MSPVPFQERIIPDASMLQKEHFLGFSSLFSTPLFGQRLVRVKQASMDNY
jgi:hypothetical protein